MEMVCVELAMHLNPLPGEGSEGADQALVFLSIPSLLVGRKEGLILEWRVSESQRCVSGVDFGSFSIHFIKSLFFPSRSTLSQFYLPASLAHSMLGRTCALAELCWAGSLLDRHIGMGGWPEDRKLG